jgi:hypothetical protein
VLGTGTVTLAVAICVAGCGGSGSSPNQTVENYINTLAEGNYSQACSMLPGAQQSAFARAIGPRATCVSALRRCIPRQSTNTSQDQTQLFYANVQATVTGRSAIAYLSGTTVARAVKSVDLIEQRGTWYLSTYGVGLEQCARASHRLVRRR